jgi:hypothetical protein
MICTSARAARGSDDSATSAKGSRRRARAGFGASFPALPKEKPMPSIHDFEMTSITGENVPLSNYEGRVCLIVNVASK